MRSALLAAASALLLLRPSHGVKPNILFILADDQGWGDIGYNNDPSHQYQPAAGGKKWAPNPPRTPHLDALASAPSTLVFDRFYSGSPVCSPTRSSLLTGRTPDRECVCTFAVPPCGAQPPGPPPPP